MTLVVLSTKSKEASTCHPGSELDWHEDRNVRAIGCRPENHRPKWVIFDLKHLLGGDRSLDTVDPEFRIDGNVHVGSYRVDLQVDYLTAPLYSQIAAGGARTDRDAAQEGLRKA